METQRPRKTGKKASRNKIFKETIGKKILIGISKRLPTQTTGNPVTRSAGFLTHLKKTIEKKEFRTLISASTKQCFYPINYFSLAETLIKRKNKRKKRNIRQENAQNLFLRETRAKKMTKEIIKNKVKKRQRGNRNQKISLKE